MLEVLRSLGGGARPRRLDPAVLAWIRVLELLSIRYLCISLVESYKPDYNVSTPVISIVLQPHSYALSLNPHVLRCVWLK